MMNLTLWLSLAALALPLGFLSWAWRRALHHAAATKLALAKSEAQREAQAAQLQQEHARREKIEAQLLTAAEESAALRSERDTLAAREAWLRDSETRLTQQFDAIAQKLLSDRSETLEKRQQESLGALLTPLREQLTSFRQKVEEVQLADAKDKASLLTELRALQQATQGMNAEARQLTEALRGDKKLQGNWGELILDRVLEASGLRAGHEYEKQTTLRDESGRIKRPDVIVRLPEDRAVVIDAKVTLVAWEAARGAESPAEQAAYLERHAQDLRAQLQRLATQGYAELEGLTSPDFVLLFVPVEAALAAALETDPSLLAKGFEQRVMIVGPTTLLLALRVIEMSWRRERQHQKAEEVARRAGALHDKIQTTASEMEKVGRQIATLERTWEVAMRRLATGRGSVLSQARQFVALGAGTESNPLATPAPEKAPESEIDSEEDSE
jgi:DNA recombination protein RmuC